MRLAGLVYLIERYWARVDSPNTFPKSYDNWKNKSSSFKLFKVSNASASP